MRLNTSVARPRGVRRLGNRSSRTAKRTEYVSHVEEITDDWRRERPDIDLDRFLLSIYLQRLGRIIQQDFEQLCQSRYRLRSSDLRVLLALRRRGSPYAQRPTDLFRALLITSGAVTKQVDRLVARKLVVRTRDPDYRKGFLVKLTEKGLKLVDEVAAEIAAGTTIAPEMSALSRKEILDAAQFSLRALKLLERERLAPEEESATGKRRKASATNRT
jgi:DNA-binding MarR family transcriptional regulator